MTAIGFTLGLRYAVTHHFELSLTGYDELPVAVAQGDVVLVTASSGTFTGKLPLAVHRFAKEESKSR